VGGTKADRKIGRYAGRKEIRRAGRKEGVKAVGQACRQREAVLWTRGSEELCRLEDHKMYFYKKLIKVY
jgi:hypothetical protein